MTFISTTRDVARKLMFLFRLVPSFALGNGLVNVVFTDFFGTLDGEEYTVWSPKMAGNACIYLAVEAVGFFVLTLVMEYLIRRPWYSNFVLWVQGRGRAAAALPYVPQEEKDGDVVKEEERVVQDSQDVVVLRDMKKVYPGGKAAVRGLSLGGCEAVAT
jgi:ATP-binding cassette subfamily A (ABC1) protein 1